MDKITKAIVVMDSGEKFNFSESSTKGLLEMLSNDGAIEDQKPIVINNEKGITEHIIYPKHISHIHFE